MELLNEIFPGLNGDITNYNLPEWGDASRPWEILEKKGEYAIEKQIKNMKINFKSCHDELENVSINIDGGPVYVHPSAIIDNFVMIEGPCFIGEGAMIKHAAYLRKGSWICKDAKVGHCSEIKNSIMLPGSAAPHFNYVGDSIVGFNANLGAGVKISNVRNDKMTIFVNLHNKERVDSGLKKFGALIGDNSAIGCNVVSNPGTILEPGVNINPNETLKGWISKND